MISLPLLFSITALLLKTLNHVSIETIRLPGKTQRINSGGAAALRDDNHPSRAAEDVLTQNIPLPPVGLLVDIYGIQQRFAVEYFHRHTVAAQGFMLGPPKQDRISSINWRLISVVRLTVPAVKGVLAVGIRTTGDFPFPDKGSALITVIDNNLVRR